MKFDGYHPIIQFIYFTAVITCTIVFDHPVFLGIAYVGAFVWSIKLNGRSALIFNLWLIPCLVLYAAWYVSYHHFGVTNLWQNRIGNWITLESIVYGLVLGIKIATIFMELSCVFATVTADKAIYLLGRISPNLSLFFSILLRSVPRVKKQMQRIDMARQGIGRGVHQGNCLQRFLHWIEEVSIIITWGIEQLMESAVSMKSRGYSLKGRTAFSIYRFDNRDRGLLIGFVLCIMLTYMAYVAGFTNMFYNPVIIWKPVTVWSMFSYGIYGVLVLLPFMLQLISEWVFAKQRYCNF